MNLTQIAARNIKQNFSKYVMYFFSLSFSVFTVFSFLALMYNESVLEAIVYDARYESLLGFFRIIILVFVMFFLISSNKSFIRARKKEISTYALFGMSNWKIGTLLFLETMLVGLVALLVGLGAGVFFSKLNAMFLLNLALDGVVDNIAFTLDPRAIYYTVLPFSVVFVLMGLSGLRVVSKFELVELFRAGKMAESRFEGSVLILLVSLLLIGTGYYIAWIPDVRVVSSQAISILLLVIVGTYLFFWQGLPKVLNIFKRHKGKYYIGENLISVSLFSHRMRSIGSLMATIAVLSAVAATAISTGFSLYRNITINAYNTVGFDMYFYGGQETIMPEIEAAFLSEGVQILDSFTTERYQTRPKFEPVIIDNIELLNSEQGYFRVYSESIYNKLIQISRTALEPVNIHEGKAMWMIQKGYRSSTEQLVSALIGKTLQFTDRDIEITSLEDSSILLFGALNSVLVLDDNDFAVLLEQGEITNTNPSGTPYDQVSVFRYERPLHARKLNNDLNKILTGRVSSYRIAYNNYIEALEIFGLVCFIGFFMSVVFILMTASLLYFKLIMAAEDEKRHYQMLRKIGLEQVVEKKVIRKRLFPVFVIPLLVGIIHSVFAMKTADTMVFTQMISAQNSYLIVLSSSAVMYVAYALVYGIFYYITRHQYTRIVRF
ncbi:MAG: ABC transporter permease [Firmicutes bacterium]|nr:ABC transporter permease [Bacillota bacterium]MDD4263370.1 ABC transporter permease [Bacillota bacterium]MDD4693392.1 ABC transporter permease [Bacillota bacterium]